MAYVIHVGLFRNNRKWSQCEESDSTHTQKEKESPQMNDNQQNVCDSFESTLKSSRYFSTLKPQDK